MPNILISNEPNEVHIRIDQGRFEIEKIYLSQHVSSKITFIFQAGQSKYLSTNMIRFESPIQHHLQMLNTFHSPDTTRHQQNSIIIVQHHERLNKDHFRIRKIKTKQMQKFINQEIPLSFHSIRALNKIIPNPSSKEFISTPSHLWISDF